MKQGKRDVALRVSSEADEFGLPITGKHELDSGAGSLHMISASQQDDKIRRWTSWSAEVKRLSPESPGRYPGSTNSQPYLFRYQQLDECPVGEEERCTPTC